MMFEVEPCCIDYCNMGTNTEVCWTVTQFRAEEEDEDFQKRSYQNQSQIQSNSILLVFGFARNSSDKYFGISYTVNTRQYSSNTRQSERE